MRPKFKVGDKVIRIKDKWQGMKKGDVGTVSRITAAGDIYIKEFHSTGSHYAANFKLHKTSWRDRIEDCS